MSEASEDGPRNTELFDRIADQIEREPERYDQTILGWTRPENQCGTPHCVAGWAAALSGAEPCKHPKWVDWGFVAPEGDDVLENTLDFATERLGLSDGEADALFDYHWKPPEGETPAEALRRIGRGGAI